MKILVHFFLFLISASLLTMCNGLSSHDYKLAGSRQVVPLIKTGETFKIRNKYGHLTITAKSDLIRTLDWGEGIRETTLTKYSWGRGSYKDIINPLEYSYANGGFGYLGKGGTTRIVYQEKTMIFKSDRERNEFMKYPYHQKDYDMQNYPDSITAGFSFVPSREQIDVIVYKLDIE